MKQNQAEIRSAVVTAIDELAGALQILEVCEYAVIGYSQMTTGAAEFNLAALIEMGVEKVRAQEQALAQVLNESRTP